LSGSGRGIKGIIEKRIGRISIVSYEVGYDAANGVGSVAEIATDGVRDFEEEDAWGIDDAETFDSGDILSEDKLCIGTRVKKTFSVPKSLKFE
jgi:hypothetical protein